MNITKAHKRALVPVVLCLIGAPLQAQEPADAAGGKPAWIGTQRSMPAGSDAAAIDAQFAAGRHENGKALANIGRRFVMGDTLSLDIVVQPTADGFEIDPEAESPDETVYMGMANSTYEQIYLIAGEKKYMLVRDGEDNAAATQNFRFGGTGNVIGQWTGVFPAPPEDTPILLYLPGFSPIGPFAVPAS